MFGDSLDDVWFLSISSLRGSIFKKKKSNMGVSNLDLVVDCDKYEFSQFSSIACDGVLLCSASLIMRITG